MISRSRSRSSGCGFSINLRRTARFTTSPKRCKSSARSTSTLCENRCRRSSRATRCCALRSPNRTECRFKEFPTNDPCDLKTIDFSRGRGPRAGNRVSAVAQRRGATSVQPIIGSDAACDPAQSSIGRARLSISDASHRIGRLVDGRAIPGSLCSLRGVLQWQSLSVVRLADPIRGFRRVAERVAPGRSSRRAATPLEKATSGHPRTVGISHRSAASRRAELPWRLGIHVVLGDSERGGPGIQPSRGHDFIHDLAGGVQDIAVPLHGARRHRRRFSYGRAQLGRNRGV